MLARLTAAPKAICRSMRMNLPHTCRAQHTTIPPGGSMPFHRRRSLGPCSCLTDTYLADYTSIHNHKVIDHECGTHTTCSSEHSPIRPGGLSSSDCAAKASRRSPL